MFIKIENGDLINSRFVYEITVSERFSNGQYGVVAKVHMSGTRILSYHDTLEEAKEARDKYFQMN